VEKYSKAQGRTAVSFNQTDLVCCRTLLGHSGKVVDRLTLVSYPNFAAEFANSLSVVPFLVPFGSRDDCGTCTPIQEIIASAGRVNNS
jgi:hypothetical protein